MELPIEKINELADRVVKTFADGFQLSDVGEMVAVVTEAMDLANKAAADAEKMTSEEKEAAARAVIHKALADTDFEWLPDFIADPVIEEIAVGLIPVIVKLTKGHFDINK